MLRALILSFITLTTLSFSCHKNCRPDEEKTGLVGKWNLIQYYVDPGDGSGTWGAPPPNQTFADFNPDGSLTSDIYFLSGYNRYEITSTSMLTFYRTDNSSITMAYELAGSSLIIRPPCFEGCGMKFKRK